MIFAFAALVAIIVVLIGLLVEEQLSFEAAVVPVQSNQQRR